MTLPNTNMAGTDDNKFPEVVNKYFAGLDNLLLEEYKKVNPEEGLFIQKLLDDGYTMEDYNNFLMQRAGMFRRWKVNLKKHLFRYEVKITVFVRRLIAADKSSIDVAEIIIEKTLLRMRKKGAKPKILQNGSSCNFPGHH